MKTIGILTFHYVDNYGAIMQAYALKTAIDKFKECKSEIINHIPTGWKNYPYERGKNGFERFEKKRRSVERFLTTHCGITKSSVDIVQGNEFDYYCVGSDQVWNPTIIKDMSMEYFFPHLDENAVRFSYAASIAEDIGKLDIGVYKKYLVKFKKIALREDEGYKDFLQYAIDNEIERTIDPTLLLHVSDYENLFKDRNYKTKPYVLFFWYDCDNDYLKGVELSNKIARKYGLKTIHSIVGAPSYIFQNDAGCMMYEDMEGFLWYVKNAEFVITNSFHGCIFSLLFEKPFYWLIPEWGRVRCDTLTKFAGIEDRVVDSYLNSSDINMNIDFTRIKKNIKQEREKSLEFLKGALDINEK